MERDPRANPKPGDVVSPAAGWEHHVSGIGHRGAVLYSIKRGGQWLNSTYRASLKEWREWAANAEVIHRGENQ